MKRVIFVFMAVAIFLSPITGHGERALVEARSYWLYEIGTGTTLAEYQSNEKKPAASLTKLMTCLLTLEAIDRGLLAWDEAITLPKSYVNPGGSSMELMGRQTVTIRQLVKGLLIVSANDGAGVLAARLHGDEGRFVQRMNARAKELGMEQTHYLNATGLPTESGENMTSAADIGRLSNYLLKTYGETLLAITGQPVLNDPARNYSLPATNTLMRLKPGVDGLKTGHTDNAGYCLAATIPFHGKADARLIAVVMGTSGETARNHAAKQLIDWAEKNYDFKVIIDQAQKISAGNWNDIESKPVQGHPEKSVERLIKADAKVAVTLAPSLPEKLPLRKGDVIGSITADLPDGETVTVPLISDTEILKLTLQERFEAAFNALRAWIESLLPS